MDAVRDASGSVEKWCSFFKFPKAVLLAPPRGGQAISKKRSQADLLLDRIRRWPTEKDSLWDEVKRRAGIAESKCSSQSVLPNEKEHSIQAAAVAALRDGDVQKALRIITDAPLAPKNESTLLELRKLHPLGKPLVLTRCTKRKPFVKNWSRQHSAHSVLVPLLGSSGTALFCFNSALALIQLPSCTR